ncbi:VOC family protein [Methylovorus sp. MM2]|uniref:VOC family protein n=1 Tax=Methylovorus sp. MM2 TaxID=1848038 RepID=UPI002698C3CE
MTSKNTRPNGLLGMRHVALFVQDIEACLKFYVDILGMQVEWQPDADNYYLTSGTDNLALHRASDSPSGLQRLDHIGFILKAPEDVDAWHAHFIKHGIKVLQQPKTHRDGARSFYCADPSGAVVQMIYHPPIADMA